MIVWCPDVVLPRGKLEDLLESFYCISNPKCSNDVSLTNIILKNFHLGFIFQKSFFNILLSHPTLYLFIYCGALWWWWVLDCTSGRMCNQTCNETVVSDCHQLQLIILSRIPCANR